MHIISDLYATSHSGYDPLRALLRSGYELYTMVLELEDWVLEKLFEDEGWDDDEWDDDKGDDED